MEILKMILCIGFCMAIATYIAFMIAYAINDLVKVYRANKSKD